MADRKSRPTLRDIAARVGVSETAASFALNGRPGISEATRQRVLAVVEELGWTPNYAARALSGARASTIGLVIARSVQDFGSEAFFLSLMTGMQRVLSESHYALLFQVVHDLDEEIDTYRRWHNEKRVDGVVVVDLRVDDPRPAALAKLGLPAVIAGGPEPGGLLTSVSIDDAEAMASIMSHLRAMGHTRVAYMSGTEDLLHIHRRVGAFHEAATTYQLEWARVFFTGFSAAAGDETTERVLGEPQPPTAMIYDNEALAVAGVGAIRRMGLAIPRDVAVVAWEDTIVCTALQPQLTALHRDATGFGADVADHLLKVMDGRETAGYAERVPTLIVRGSTLGAV